MSVLVAAGLGLVPQNGVSCAGGDADPKDYFTSFFSRKASGADESYRPFYYTLVRNFYDADESSGMESQPNAALVNEWSRYCGGTSTSDTRDVLFRYDLPTLERLHNTNDALPDSLRNNACAVYLAGKTDAVDYLLFAKKMELLTSNGSDWDAPARDSAQMVAMAGRARQLHASAGTDFLRTRYAFQVCKSEFYAERFAKCIEAYDRLFRVETGSEVQTLALSYKAGALFRLGRKEEAAYAFSRVFAATSHDRRGSFLGFLWSSNNADSSLRERYAAQARTPKEKAALIGLFGMYGETPATGVLEQVYALDKQSPLLPLLASREISKLEEQYLSPMIGHQLWQEAPTAMERKAQLESGKLRAAALAHILERFAADANVEQRAFYAAGAAYLYLLDEQWNASRTQLAAAEQLQPSAAQQDQLKMLRLLLAANEPRRLTAREEDALLPATEWLISRARTDDEYRPFLRDFFSELLHTRYVAQGDTVRANLAIGVGDLHFLSGGSNAWWNGNGTTYLHERLTAAQTEKLYALLNAPATPWERFMATHASINRNTVVETIGTGHLREGNYAKAIEWLERADSLEPMQGTVYDADWNDKPVNVDPFHDYLNDWQRYGKRLPQPYTKLTFARKMQELHQKALVSAATEDIAKANYELANAYYNMSQYGNAWMAVSWSRGSSDWNEGGYKTAWEKDFFEVNRARKHYAEALRWSKNREFKAACHFMMAKCAQKQIPRPSWSSRHTYEEMERRETAFQKKFRNNALFPAFVKEYGSTKFYQYTYKRCSYLRDFVKKQKTVSKKK
ncbi:MAG: hypothetical protein EOO08_09280 [Chitinophagaceae bacterium]|nr:MAG: hypothetical protein EOO08_09280 [Chitinophagaceae bacterium]